MIGHLSLPCPIQEPQLEVPEFLTQMPNGAPSLREEVLPQGDLPGRGCHKEHQVLESGMGGPAGHSHQQLLVLLDLHKVCAMWLTGENAYYPRVGECCSLGFVQGIKQLVMGGLCGREKMSWSTWVWSLYFLRMS